MPPRIATKPKSVRKPLRELPINDNSNNNGVGRFSKSANLKKKSKEKQIEEEEEESWNDDGTLDRLLLVQSDLSALLKQIDELVVQAFKVKTTSNVGRKEVESFMNVLSNMLSTLKPWVPRFQKVHSSPVVSEKQLGETLTSKSVGISVDDNITEFGSPEENNKDMLISPSPLVSWRANCTIQRNRQLFLLTPLPMSKAFASKHQDLSKSLFCTSNYAVEVPPLSSVSGDINDDLLGGMALKQTLCKPSESTVAEMGNTIECGFVSSAVALKQTLCKPSESAVAEMGNTIECGFVSSPMCSKKDQSELLMTPCFNMSPPKSCVLLEPISESSHRPNARFHKSTPFPFGLQKGLESSESSGSEDSRDLAFKYPELLGIRQACKSGFVKNKLEASPHWSFSPPKSCVLLELPDQISTENAAADASLPVASVTNLQVKEKENEAQSGYHQSKKSCHPEFSGGNATLMESTPLWKEPESILRTGKRLGESTLKKELWTKFEAASTFGLRYNATAIQKTAQKGFLDMLEEASGEGECSLLDGLR